MAHAKRIEFALLPHRERRKTLFSPQCTHTFAATGEYLVRIGLVTHVPDELIVWGIQDIVKCNGEFDHAEAGPEMTACLTHGIDQEVA